MAIVRKCRSKVISIEQPVSNVFVVTLESLEKKYKFKPGQFLHLALEPFIPSEAWPDSRCFSIQSPPEESYLKLTYSVKGKFTTRMAAELYEGREVCLKLPYGDLFQKTHNKNGCVFIAGGTGITPYLSLLSSSDFIEYKNPKLYLGIKDTSFNIYEEDLKKAIQMNQSMEINIVNQETKGVLDIEKIFLKNGAEPNYFISGPPAMINSFRRSLLEKQVNENNIRTDDWE